jgi:hypothetical protein
MTTKMLKSQVLDLIAAAVTLQAQELPDPRHQSRMVFLMANTVWVRTKVTIMKVVTQNSLPGHLSNVLELRVE